jgi:CDP-diacylglycerol--serine O-phosphatidyltransferase
LSCRFLVPVHSIAAGRWLTGSESFVTETFALRVPSELASPQPDSSQSRAMPEIKPRKTLFNPELRRRGIYVLPNLFTTAALFCGFFAIVKAMSGSFEQAAVAIFVAMVLDGLDGRVARMTRTQSAFGAEYDSLSDMVSFGVAPALVTYAWALKDMGRLGWIAAFIYCAGAALRLARFNTTLEVMDRRYFQGLPSPAAAAVVDRFSLGDDRQERRS